MCGICGEWNGSPEHRELRLRAMCAAMRHRGPDDEGIYVSSGIGLGHRRLSILDISGGHQPLASIDGNIQVVCNGEIYNHEDLRKTLGSQGASFQTHSDSEVLVHLYASMRKEWTTGSPRAFLEQLNGMFAFAIWDEEAGRLFLARDRMGQKPLYYTMLPDGGVRFASELPSLRTIAQDSFETDPSAAWHFFKYGYIPAPLSIDKGIAKLPAAHYLLADHDGVAIQRYWSLPDPSEGIDGTDEQLTERFEELLHDAVQQRLMSDVPLGAFLSGGIDSSAVTALMKTSNAPSPKTFCIGFDEHGYDEREHARAVAESQQAEHHEQVVDIKLTDIIPEFPNHFGEPFGDSSSVNVWYLSEMTRKNVTVALSGDGADELLGGYRRYLGYRLTRYYLLLPKFLRNGLIAPLVNLFSDPGGYYGDSLTKQAKLFVNQARRIEDAPLALAPEAFTNKALQALLPGIAPPEIDLLQQRAEHWKKCDPLSQMMRMDMETYLPDDILVKVDRMSMAHALEVRSPFMDHRVVELCCRLPLRMKLRGKKGKYILRNVAAKHVPPHILNRPKHGFMLPLDTWLRGGLHDAAKDATMALPTSLFDRTHIETLWQEHETNRHDNAHPLWLLWMWSLLHRPPANQTPFLFNAAVYNQ